MAFQLRIKKPVLKFGRRTRRIFLALIITVVFVVLPQYIALPQNPPLDKTQIASMGGSLVEVGVGTQVFYQEFGDPSNPVLLFIHGFGGASDNWRNNLQVVASKGFRVVAVDLPGFGLSSKDYKGSYSHASQAAVLGQFMDLLGINDVTLVGHSMGGNVALHAAFNFASRVKRVVLVDAAVVESSPNNDTFSYLLNKFPSIKIYAQLLLRLALNQSSYLAIFQNPMYRPAPIADQTRQYVDLIFQSPNWDESLVAVLRDSGRNGLPKKLSELEIPVHIIWGRKDPWISLSEGEDLSKQFPNATLDVIDDAGHLPMVEQVEKFNQTLLSRLQSN